MTVSNADLVTAVAKLNDMTRRKEVNWTSARGINEKNRSIIASYCAPYEGRTFRITELRPLPKDELYHDAKNRYRLEILDEQNLPIFEFPNIQGISDLFDSVRIRHADVEGLIRSLITTK
jgi:hypothetical protein